MPVKTILSIRPANYDTETLVGLNVALEAILGDMEVQCEPYESGDQWDDPDYKIMAKHYRVIELSWERVNAELMRREKGGRKQKVRA